MRLELVSRRGCHLCEDAESAARAAGLEVAILDVDADPELARLYDFRVPVLLGDGRVLAEGVIDPAWLRRLRR